jgi:hypothetical protein
MAYPNGTFGAKANAGILSQIRSRSLPLTRFRCFTFRYVNSFGGLSNNSDQEICALLEYYAASGGNTPEERRSNQHRGGSLKLRLILSKTANRATSFDVSPLFTNYHQLLKSNL